MEKTECAILLRNLAEKYEKPDFTKEDPSQFLKRYGPEKDAELAGFIAAMFAFGSRAQFLPKTSALFDLADLWCKSNGKNASIHEWIQNGDFSDFMRSADGDTSKKYYRFYSYKDVADLLSRLSKIIRQSGTLGSHIKNIYENQIQSFNATATSQKTVTGSETNAGTKPELLVDLVAREFSGVAMVPQTKASCKKRICMFLRWMVRQNSCVDLGIWNWYDQKNLIIPLDTHVMQEAVEFGFISPNSTASMKTALQLTEQLKIIFPDDPAKADFALFGLGVEKIKARTL